MVPSQWWIVNHPPWSDPLVGFAAVLAVCGWLPNRVLESRRHRRLYERPPSEESVDV